MNSQAGFGRNGLHKRATRGKQDTRRKSGAFEKEKKKKKKKK
jgi:hypothetical protein